MRVPALSGLIAAAALLGSCHRGADNKTIEASVIGATLDLPTGKAALYSPPATLLADATREGLVRLDHDGQVIAGAAVRWAILDDGLDYIFRIDDAAGVTAREIARRLRAAIRARRSTPQGALTSAIESIDAVTGTVVEIRLSEPRPDLLATLALPEYGVGARGTMEATTTAAGPILLQPRAGIDPRPERVMVRAEPVDKAVARFAAGKTDLVLGGTFTDLPVARAANPKRGTLRFDAASGLFGLVLHDPASPAASPALRQALSQALDRDRIVTTIGADGLAKATTLAGSAIEAPLVERRANAIRLIGAARPALKVAVPPGPGAAALYSLIAQDWSTVGIMATPVPIDEPADLMLIDMVTPPGSRAALACAMSAGCDPRDRLALIAPPYIPISAPVRWSLATRRLDQFMENELAAHPLDRLRKP
jgi:oligopeptide transport system substrate-binding protein